MEYPLTIKNTESIAWIGVLIPVVMEYPLTTITELERDGVTS